MSRYNKGVSWKYDWYKPGNAYFICDICAQRFRRSLMLTQWDGLKVDARCISPRPPQMIPPVIYPEGMPFVDARLPQDNGDRLQDDTSLQAVPGGFLITPPGQLYPNGQNPQPGALSPQMLVENPTPQGADVLADDITFITGVEAALSAWPINVIAPSINGNSTHGSLLTGNIGTWEFALSYSYQWIRNSSSIAGATNLTYTTTVSDIGSKIFFQVTAINSVASNNSLSLGLMIS